MNQLLPRPRNLVIVCFVVSVQVAVAGTVHAQASPLLTRAIKLFRNRQHADAVKLLVEDIQGKQESKCATQHLLLGECYYAMRDFAAARPHYVKAVRNLKPGKNRGVAEERLVKVLYSLKDFDGAMQRIESFLDRNGDDKNAGVMLAYKLKIISRGKNAQTVPIEQLHQQIKSNAANYGQSAVMEADRILCAHYQEIGQIEKARGLYSQIVYGFRKAITERQQKQLSIPESLTQTHDNAALQLGLIEMNRKRTNEAIKWLENVRYDGELIQQAKLRLAKLHFERRDFNRAVSLLTDKQYLDSVPDGRLKSDMYLVLGLAESSREGGDIERVQRWLTLVTEESKGYLQAQRTLADIFRERALYASAIACYQRIVKSPQLESHALYSLGLISIKQAEDAKTMEKEAALHRQASALFNQLFAKYPLSAEVKLARKHVDALQAKGVDVSFALSGDEKLKLWMKTAREHQGTVQGAQSLMSLIRTHSKEVVDPQTGQRIKTPNHVACAAACDQLLDAALYKGKDFEPEQWQALLAEAAFHRSQCELASLARTNEPHLLTGATPQRAIELFQRAREIADPKNLELVKQIRLGLVEAMFKTGDVADIKVAETEFKKLESDYGNDARFQHLAMELAKWYEDHGQDEQAAHHYAAIADRSQQLTEDQRLQLLYKAGTLLGRSARNAQSDPTANSYAVYIYPNEVIDLSNRLLSTHYPFRTTIELKLPKGGKQVRAIDALLAVSKASGIPFVWIPDNRKNSIQWYLNSRRINLEDGNYRVKDALERILDLKQHRVEFDIGLSGGKPTVVPITIADDPDTALTNKVIEIYSVHQAAARVARFKPFQTRYGAFESVHGRGFDITLFRILNRMQTLTNTKIQWADGIDHEEHLAREFRGFPGLNARRDYSCAESLAVIVKQLGLRYRITQRPISADLFDLALKQYSKIRQINPQSEFGERSLFNLALDFYSQQDYEKMKIVLREYLKLFDGPEYPYYRRVSFWTGWAFENEKNYRDACAYYQRAAEERLVVDSRIAANTATKASKPIVRPLPSKQELQKQLSYELQFALAPPLNGQFKDTSLVEFVDYLRVNTYVDFSIDASARSRTIKISRAAFKGVSGFDLLYQILVDHELGVRIENVEPAVAERAYYRLASAFQKDNVMDQALENCNLLLTRFPNTKRRPDAYRLMIDIYKGLKDYGRVIDTLDMYRAAVGDTVESYKLDAELARAYFDMAAYGKASSLFKGAMRDAKPAMDRLAIQDGYAKALYRAERFTDALPHFQVLAKEAADPLRAFIAEQFVFLIKLRQQTVTGIDYPQENIQFIQQYERLSDEERNRLSKPKFIKATWIYFVLAQIDLAKGRRGSAKRKLDAVTTSPDELLAGDAAYVLGALHLQDGELDDARQVLEHLLFTTRSAESAVRGTYVLGLCWLKLGKPELAGRRFQQLITRYPQSPLADRINRTPSHKKLSEAARP